MVELGLEGIRTLDPPSVGQTTLGDALERSRTLNSTESGRGLGGVHGRFQT